MLVKILNNKPIGYINVGSPALELEYLETLNDLIQVPDIEITEDIKYYEIVDNTLKLVSNFLELKESEVEAERLKTEELAEAERLKAEANKPSLEELKELKITELNNKVNVQYKAYLSKYPDIEIESFKEKAKETALVIADNNIALTQTPYLTKLTQNTSIEARNSLAFAVDTKIQETAQLESYAVSTRDLIKACETVEELEAILM